MLRVLGTRVLVKPIECKREIDGIVIPETVEKHPMKFEVIGVGDDVLEVEVGQKVIFSEYGGTEITKDGETFRIIEEDEILAIVE